MCRRLGPQPASTARRSQSARHPRPQSDRRPGLERPRLRPRISATASPAVPLFQSGARCFISRTSASLFASLREAASAIRCHRDENASSRRARVPTPRPVPRAGTSGCAGVVHTEAGSSRTRLTFHDRAPAGRAPVTPARGPRTGTAVTTPFPIRFLHISRVAWEAAVPSGDGADNANEGGRAGAPRTPSSGRPSPRSTHL